MYPLLEAYSLACGNTFVCKTSRSLRKSLNVELINSLNVFELVKGIPFILFIIFLYEYDRRVERAISCRCQTGIDPSHCRLHLSLKYLPL